MESFMLSSSFINLFALPLDEFPEEECFGKPNFVISSQIQDPWKVTRPVVDLSWDPKNVELIAAAYADHRASSWQQYNDRFAYIWNTRNTSEPAFILDGEAPLTVVEFNTMESNEIAGCTMCGQIGLWDIRVGSTSVWLSGRRTFHDRPTCLQWCSRFTGYELTAAALDGQILWYDMRNRTVPIDKVILDMSRNPNPKWQNAIGVTSYCFEPNLPTKFLVGTATGMVIEGNKKGKTISEKIGNRIFQCSNGPILNVFRNPKFTKYFFTIGDWLLKMWCDDYTNEPIYWTDFDSAMLTCAVWSKVKSSVVLVGRDDGQVDLWDYLENETIPRFSLT
uniref:Uncharacterized protein n=2 Tax=Rhodnius prolixus TaxID=13249 RepID=T1HK42_RHOPR